MSLSIFPQRAIIRTKSRIVFSELKSTIDGVENKTERTLYEEKDDYNYRGDDYFYDCRGVMSDDRKQVAYLLCKNRNFRILIIDVDKINNGICRTKILKILQFDDDDTGRLNFVYLSIFSFCGDTFLIKDSEDVLTKYQIYSVSALNIGETRRKTSALLEVSSCRQSEDYVMLTDEFGRYKFCGSDGFIKYESTGEQILLTGDIDPTIEWNIISVNDCKVTMTVDEKIHTYHINVRTGSTQLEENIPSSTIYKHGNRGIEGKRIIPTTGQPIIIGNRGYFTSGVDGTYETFVKIDNLLDVLPLQIFPDDLNAGVDEVYKCSGLIKDVIEIIVEYIILL